MSLVIITTGITTEITRLYARTMSKPFTNTLSAIASATLPKSVTKLFLRAIWPSKKSDTEAIKNKIPTTIYFKSTCETFPT